MHTGRDWEILSRSLTALTLTLALAVPGVAAATARSAPASQIVDAGHNVWTLGNGVLYKNGNAAGYSANLSPLLFSVGNVHQRNKDCKWCAWRGSGFAATSSLVRGTVPTTASGFLVTDIAFVSTRNVSPLWIVGPSISGLETGMKWRSSSFSIAGSRVWSKVIKFTSTGVALRVPLN